MTLPLTCTQSIPDSVEEHSTCLSVCKARFESRWRSQGDRSMCFSSIDGEALQSPVIKTDCQTAIKVMDSPKHHQHELTLLTANNSVETRHIFSLWRRGGSGSSRYQTHCGQWAIKLRILFLLNVFKTEAHVLRMKVVFLCVMGLRALFAVFGCFFFISSKKRILVWYVSLHLGCIFYLFI